MTLTTSSPPTTSVETSPAVSPVGDVLRAWLHLANLQFSPRLTSALLTHFREDPLAVFAARDAELEMVPGLMARHLVRLRDKTLEVTERQWTWYERHNVRLITRHHSDYPALLHEIPDPPPLFFLRGTLAKADEISVGIVGSRHATPYGRAVSERLARELAGHGLTIVSGGAVGIDTAAHRGALEGGGRTLAILGCGLDVDYPRDNRALFEKVIESGAVISEYPLGAQPEAWRFPITKICILYTIRPYVVEWLGCDQHHHTTHIGQVLILLLDRRILHGSHLCRGIDDGSQTAPTRRHNQ